MSNRPKIYSTLLEDPDLEELVAEFVSNIPSRLLQILTHLQSGDHAQLVTVVHQLRGACGSYGFAEITPIATEVEHLLKTSTQDVWYPKLVQFIDACRQMTAGHPEVEDAKSVCQC